MKMEDMEFLKVMLVEMNANMKSNLENAEAYRKADSEALKEMKKIQPGKGRDQ